MKSKKQYHIVLESNDGKKYFLDRNMKFYSATNNLMRHYNYNAVLALAYTVVPPERYSQVRIITDRGYQYKLITRA